MVEPPEVEYLRSMWNDVGGRMGSGEMGRVGGILMMLVGVPGLGFVIFVGVAMEDYVSMVAYGSVPAVVIAMGWMAFRRAQQARIVPHMSRAALRGLVENQPLGFSVCARCCVIMPGNLLGSCTSCLSPAECVIVASEADRKTALAAIPRQ